MVTRILVVEDHPLFAEAICGVLLSAIKGVDVICATTLNEAKELLDKDRRFDLVLLDLMMPEPNGWQVYREMKADEGLAQLPVIVVTASIWEGNSRVLFDDLPPVEDYITKPFDMLRLMRAIEQILKRKAAV